MRIVLRTSGGRGEYELAGTQDMVRVHDVLGRHLVLEMLPSHRIHTGNYIRHTQGKPRIRLHDQKLNRHIYLILAAILLLPKPKREIGATPAGKLQIYKDNFSIASIAFDIVELTDDELIISPTQAILSNSSEDCVRLDVMERMRLVMSVWEAAEKNPVNTSDFLLSHKNAFDNANVRKILDTCEELRRYNVEQDDPLQYAARSLDVSNRDSFSWMAVHAIVIDEAIALGETTLESFREAARNRVKTWRHLALRGAEGEKFSSDVKAAYNNTCLFTGFYLPKTELGSAGVDAAHILPWAKYDINRINNGLCLSKLCHWAFDNRILVLDFNNQTDRYILSIPQHALQAEAQHRIDLTPFHAISGTIPNSLLPKDKGNWPDVRFLRAYNASSDD